MQLRYNGPLVFQKVPLGSDRFQFVFTYLRGPGAAGG